MIGRTPHRMSLIRTDYQPATKEDGDFHRLWNTQQQKSLHQGHLI